MPPHPFTNFEIQKYCQKELKFNGISLRHNLPKTKDGAYVINLDEIKLIETHWIALYVNGNNEHLTMQYLLIALELNILQKKF